MTAADHGTTRTTTDARRPRRRIARWVLAGVVGLLVLAVAGYVVRNLAYARWDAWRAERAGFVEKRTTIDGSTINYAEGPDNGPPLLLIHGQATTWQSWHRVLPDLSERFHVFAVDVYGHGKSARVPEKYTARAIAADMEQFLTQVVGEPATVAGHSSGGLIAAVLAADAPQHVRGVILEDPPFFSSVLPRAEKTFTHVGLHTAAHEFLESGENDFTDYFIRHANIWNLIPGIGDDIQRHALSYRRNHPGEPVRLFYAPPTLNNIFLGLESYDPHFGDAFYTNRFHDGFDHADTLARIDMPAVLIHTNWMYDKNGILLAAMSGEDARRARSLLEDVEFYRVTTGHGFHFEDPDHFTQITLDFEGRIKG